MSAHPARFSPDDKYSRHRNTIKKRFGIHPIQQPKMEMWNKHKDHLKKRQYAILDLEKDKRLFILSNYRFIRNHCKHSDEHVYKDLSDSV